jgi:hypothetical protein
VRLLDTDREEFVFAFDRRAEKLPLMHDATRVQELEDETNRLFLRVVAAPEITPEACKLVRPITRAQPDQDAPARQDVDERHIFHHAHGLVERHRHHRGAEPDARRLSGQVPHVCEDVGHDPILVREVMLGDPGRVVAERVCRLNLRRHPCVDLTVRIGLAGVVGV